MTKGPFDARDLGPVEVVVNDVRYVREETLFAAMREADRLREASGRWAAMFDALLAEMERQDAKHGPFEGSRLGRSRLALACIEDEYREALQAWRDERKADYWIEAPAEVLQVAAVAMRALRDAFSNDVSPAVAGASNRV